jgi:ABC-2 type transport system permease protein
MHKTKKTIGISLGIVFISYFLNIISELSSKVEYLKYFSINTLGDVRNIIDDISINPINILISLIITIIFISLTYIRYNKKELV